MSQILDLHNHGKTLLIYNPRAGRSVKRPPLAEIVAQLQPTFGELVVQTTAHPGHATELARQFGRDYDTVICCGGDGTLSEVINGLLAADAHPKIGYIPMGSTNDLAKNIGLPTSLDRVTEVLSHGRTVQYDIGRFNDRYFTYFASFGPGVSVSYSTPQRMKNMLGYSAYMINGFVLGVVPALREVKPKHIRVEYDGKVLEDDFYFGAVSNAYSAAGIIKYNEDDVCFNDGKYEVMLVRRLHHPAQLFSMLHKIRRRDYDGETLLYLHASRLRFTFSSPVKWTLDGECSGDVQDVSIEVLPGAVRLCSEGNRGFRVNSAQQDPAQAQR